MVFFGAEGVMETGGIINKVFFYRFLKKGLIFSRIIF